MPVYIIGTSQDAEVVKIGWTKGVEARLRGLQTSNPDRLRVLRVIDRDFGAERWMHERYDHLRTNGEWFSTDPEMFTVVPPDFSSAAKIIAESLVKPTLPGVSRGYPLDAIGRRDINVVGHHFDYDVGRWVLGVADCEQHHTLDDFLEQIRSRVRFSGRRGISIDQMVIALRGEADAMAGEAVSNTQAVA